jgi:hypothetical protein
MSIAITSSGNRFSVNGSIFKDFINLNKVLSVSLCKDRYYNRFDILFYFKLGTRNASYTDENLIRVGPFSNKVLDKAEELVARFFKGDGEIFNIEEELYGKTENMQVIREEEQEFVNQAKLIAIETAKKMKSEGLPVEIISKALGLVEIEFSG